MIRKRLYTFIIANHTDAKIWRVSLPMPGLLSLGFFALAGIIAAGVAAFHYGQMLTKVADYNHLLAENNSFRSENHNYRIQTAQLGEKIDFLETMSHKLMTISGMNAERGIGGTGGVSRETFSHPLPASAGTLKSIDRYNRNIDSLEQSYRHIENFVSDNSVVEASTPSIWPVKGYVTGGFGRRENPFDGSYTETHPGLDISAPYGTRVEAAADGTVIFAGTREGYGNIVVVDHKFGTVTRYAHLSRINVQVGQRVFRHDAIGYVGSSGRSTGPHLHFELLILNRPVNPAKYIPRTKNG